MTRTLAATQTLMGVGAHLLLAVPYLRRVHGLGRLNPRERHLFVSNHVSLLDTILLGSLFWRSGCYPVLVLGDRNVWHASWIRRALSSRIGFLLERGKLNPGRIRELQAFGRAAREFQLLVFPEGRADGVTSRLSTRAVFHCAGSRVPVVPLFIRKHDWSRRSRGPPLGG
jgi:1-acyl-sn-glycerol-3-phosphate acyltransferase